MSHGESTQPPCWAAGGSERPRGVRGGKEEQGGTGLLPQRWQPRKVTPSAMSQGPAQAGLLDGPVCQGVEKRDRGSVDPEAERHFKNKKNLHFA